RIASLWSDGTTNYASSLSTSTLTDFVQNTQFYQVYVTSVVVNWTALGSADGYRLEAYSDAGFTTFAGSSATYSVAQTTLSIEGLQSYTTYYFRLGGINHNSVVNYE